MPKKATSSTFSPILPTLFPPSPARNVIPVEAVAPVEYTRPRRNERHGRRPVPPRALCCRPHGRNVPSIPPLGVGITVPATVRDIQLWQPPSNGFAIKNWVESVAFQY